MALVLALVTADDGYYCSLAPGSKHDLNSLLRTHTSHLMDGSSNFMTLSTVQLLYWVDCATDFAIKQHK